VLSHAPFVGLTAYVMPELPDVEHFRRTLAHHSAGRTISQVLVTDAGILRSVSALELDRAIRGHRFEEPERHGKWLIAWTDGPTVLMHFGMTGDILWAPDSTSRLRHDRVIFVLDRGEIRYRNMRKFGGVWLAHGPAEVNELLSGLGPDALGVRRTEFLNRLERRRGRVKAALMDQSFIAGIGNLLADEALWMARIHPARPIEDLADGERVALFRALRAVIRHALDSHPEDFQSRWSSARGSPAARCPRCRSQLSRIVVGGRTTYFCPVCQH
jgi:formamidopyrimidine-DNA glycosylase